MQTAFEWLFCWKLGENTTGFGKITKETEMQKKQKLQKGEKKKWGRASPNLSDQFGNTHLPSSS